MNQGAQRHVRIHVRGRVQGVGFRAAARAEGRALGIDVDARNLDDDSVMIEAQGPDEAVDELIVWAQAGPPTARVDAFNVEEIPS